MAEPHDWSELELCCKYDFARGAITIASPTINGTYNITARTPPLYPDGTTYPSRNATTLFAPQLYWTENVLVGDVQAEFNVEGTSLSCMAWEGASTTGMRNDGAPSASGGIRSAPKSGRGR